MKGYYYTDFITGKLIDFLQNDHSEKNEDDAMSTNIVWKKLNENKRKFIKSTYSDMTYEEIAKKMFLNPKTVDGYRSGIFHRFNIKNSPGLILFALLNQLLKIEEIELRKNVIAQ